MKIVFFGSDDFAVTNLEKLVNSKHQVLACVTQPDKGKGRHLEVSVSPVKEFAMAHHIPLLQAKILNDNNFISQLKSYNSDLFVVVAYGQILPREILNLPKIFCINIHGSLLPKYRGAAPINWAIIKGEKMTGISIIKMNMTMDAGDIISQKQMKIDEEDTSVTIRGKTAKVAAELLLKTLNSIEKKTHTLTKQNKSDVTIAPKLTKGDGLIDWNKSAIDIHNLVRGLLPWPAAFTHYCGKLLKILETDIVDIDSGRFNPGEVIGISEEGFSIVTGKGVLRIRRLHPESSKVMDAKSFVLGHKLGIGFRFE